MEKLALVLLIASRKLKPYFQAHVMVVFTSHPLRQVLHCLEALDWLMKWSIKLSQYEIHYLLSATIKSQVVLIFIIDLTPKNKLNWP